MSRTDVFGEDTGHDGSGLDVDVDLGVDLGVDLDAARESPRAQAAARLQPSKHSDALHRLADLAARLLGAPAAQLSLLSDVQVIVGSAGLPAGAGEGSSAVADSLCTVTASAGAPMVVTDATQDERVAHLPPVTGGAIGAYLGVPLTDEAGATVGALCVFGPQPHTWSGADVATLEQLAAAAMAELELAALSKEHRTSQVVLDLALSAAQVGTFDVDVTTGTRLWDERMLELFGYTRSTLSTSSDPIEERVHPEDRGRVRAALQHATDTCGTFEDQYRLLLPDGRTRWVTARAQALCDERGRTVRILGAAQETTAMRQSDARTVQVLESISTAFCSLDRDWRFTYVNARAELVLGMNRQVLLGGRLWDLFPAAVGTVFETHYRQAMQDRRPVTFEAYYPEPLAAWLELTAEGSDEGLAVYFLDVTARRAAQLALERSTGRMLALSEVASALADAQDITEMVTVMAERGLPALGADGGSVAVPDPTDPTHLLSYITRNFGEGTRADFGRLPLDAALPVTVAAATGQRVLLADQAACEALSPHVVAANTATGCQAWASVPLRAEGRVIGVLTAGWKESQPFDAEQLDLLDTFAAQCSQALQRMAAREAERAATAQQAGLVAIAHLLGDAGSEDEVLSIVAAQGAELLGSNGAGLCLRQPDGEHVRSLVTSGYDGQVGALVQLLPHDFPLPAIHAAATGTAHFLPDRAATEARFPGSEPVYAAVGVEASAAAPLRAHGRLLGCLSVGFPDARTWHQSDRDLIEALAALTAQALERIASREAERTASSVAARFSETLQRSLLTSPAQPDHLEIAVRYSPAAADAQVGGDWYDAFLTTGDATSLVIGDVTGHDYGAAAAMGQLRNLLRGIGYAVEGPPARVLTVLDRAVHDLAVDAMATVVIAQVKQTPAQRAAGVRTLRWSNAGHPPPLLIGPDGTTRYLETDPDLLLGLDPDTPRADHDIVLELGASVLLFTDGLVERRGAPLQAGLDWLAGAVTALAHLPLEELCDSLLAQVGDRVEDDVALLVVRAHPEDVPRPAEAGPRFEPLHTPTLSTGRPA